MNLIRNKIRIISLLTIFIQVAIIFSSLIHNHTWHYLKLFTKIHFDSNDKYNHQDPFADETGICRINDYLRSYNSVILTEKVDQLRFDYQSTDLEFNSTDNYQYSLCKSFRLRGPPSA